MQKFLRANRRFVYHAKNLFVIGIIILGSAFYLETKYEFIIGLELMNNGNVIVDTTNKNKESNEVHQELTMPKIPILSKKSVKVQRMDPSEKNVIYNTFTINELEPYQEYDYKLFVNLEGVAPGQLITFGSQEVEPENILNEEESFFENNIDLTKAVKTTMGLDTSLGLPIKLIANDKGEAYFYIGITMEDQINFDYRISRVKLEKL